MNAIGFLNIASNLLWKKAVLGKIYTININGIDYKIMITPKNKKSIMLQDFSEKKDFYLPKKEHGTLNVFWRLKEKPTEVRTITEKW